MAGEARKEEVLFIVSDMFRLCVEGLRGVSTIDEDRCRGVAAVAAGV